MVAVQHFGFWSSMRPEVARRYGVPIDAARTGLVPGESLSQMEVYLNLQCPPTTYAERSPARVAVGMGSQMGIFQQRLLVVTHTIPSLNIRIHELERLRDQVEKAQLSARRSRPKSRRKRTRT